MIHPQERKGRWMGLDYGAKTVGVAVSDPLHLTAQGLETIQREREAKLRRTYARIEELIQAYEVCLIVVGLPKNMNNTLGERAEKAQAFSEEIRRRTGLPVVLWDERLTTMEAERILMEAQVRRENRKQHLDRMAATLILQSYMDAEKTAEENFR